MSSPMENASQLTTQLKTLKMNDENQVISSCLRKFASASELRKKTRAQRLVGGS